MTKAEFLTALFISNLFGCRFMLKFKHRKKNKIKNDYGKDNLGKPLDIGRVDGLDGSLERLGALEGGQEGA